MPKINNNYFVWVYTMYFLYHGDYTDTNRIEHTWGSLVFNQFSFCIFFLNIWDENRLRI